MLKYIETVFESLLKKCKLLTLYIILINFVRLNYVTSDISRLAITEGLIFSPRSLNLIECTNNVIPDIIKEITKIDEKNSHKVKTCLEGQHFQRSMMGLALSFSSGENLQYNKLKCPRLIASFLRDRILGYSCPYLSNISELFNFVENKELKTKDSIGKRNIRAHPNNAKNAKLPTILTSLYTRLIQSCDKIEDCFLNLDKESQTKYLKQDGPNLNKSSLDFSPNDIKLELEQNNINSIISLFPKKIGRRDILTYSNNLLRSATLEFETNFEKESPLDPFWLIQAYRMLLLYSVMLNDAGIFVNLSSYYFQKVFNYLLDTQHLRSIDSLQLQTKYLNLDKSSRKQLLFLRASYTILESCFDFWKDLHNYYVSSILTNKYKAKDLEIVLDFSKICQKGFQLPLRQSLIFFYYAGIKEVIKYSDINEKSTNNSTNIIQHDSSEFTESTENNSTDNKEWYDGSSIDFAINTPWFVESTNLFYPVTTIEELDKIYNNEVSALIKQSDPNLNPKATVLNLNHDILSGYFIGGNGSMMYRSCTYYLRRKLRKGSKELLLAQVKKMSKNSGFHEVSPSEKIRYFCWYTAKIVYPNDSTFETEDKYEKSQFTQGNFKVSQSAEKNSNIIRNKNTRISSVSSSPKRIEYQDIKSLEQNPDRASFSSTSMTSSTSQPSLSSLNGSITTRKHSSFLDDRRREILQRLYPQSSDLNMNSLAYSISDKSGDLKGVPVIKKHSNSSSPQMLEPSSLVSSIRGKYEQDSCKKKDVKENTTSSKGLMPRLLEEIKSGVKLKPTGSSASNEIMNNIRKEITSSAKAVHLGVSSSQIKNDLESTEFAPPLVETNLLDEISNNHKFLFEQ
ncbi:uncharacterized protein cubi_01961 [Cryptosporidium ubiquitum]|uniref:WH2 domain-containing protein n=1 Tax=Cryptosporidium ubiquitum TaxID=857276 RepID=A0A1J4MMM7_9CRYT|nr:uncharacterized protein cubi_01961 [Cryptosporidium ubiquitum]OII75440.1 hypothetical protein cubi_01961 [Cryptosporidium ubiquitum]